VFSDVADLAAADGAASDVAADGAAADGAASDVAASAADIAAAGVVTDALLYAMSSLSSSIVAASHCVNKPSSSSSTKGLPR